jgi:hypothetical protein
MHFEFLVEDLSGKSALEILIPKIVGSDHSFNIHYYQGSGRIPKGLKPTSDPQKRILLDQLPKLINGYGKTFAEYPPNTVAVVIVCDLDHRCLSTFRKELLDIVDACYPRPETYFCIAVEEGEAWYLGDIPAIKIAYPNAKDAILHAYENDSICGTWEKLANAIYPGGAKGLTKLGGSAIGHEKSRWAEKIAPHMDVDNNLSPSFCYFRQRLTQLITE